MKISLRFGHRILDKLHMALVKLIWMVHELQLVVHCLIIKCLVNMILFDWWGSYGLTEWFKVCLAWLIWSAVAVTELSVIIDSYPSFSLDSLIKIISTFNYCKELIVMLRPLSLFHYHFLWSFWPSPQLASTRTRAQLMILFSIYYSSLYLSLFFSIN